MFRFSSTFIFLLLAVVFCAASALAWDDPPEGTTVLMTASCSGSDVVLAVDFLVTEEPPPQFVGWVVERQVVGPCHENVLVTQVMPWPELGETHLELTITPDVDYFDAIYRIWAVDADGNQTFIYWPQRHNFAHADCLPGPSTVGRFVSWAGIFAFEACTEGCWPGLSPFDGSYPDGAEDLVDTGQVMALYGELFMGMEGVYINASSMAPSTIPCDPLANEPASWCGLKANYR